MPGGEDPLELPNGFVDELLAQVPGRIGCPLHEGDLLDHGNAPDCGPSEGTAQGRRANSRAKA